MNSIAYAKSREEWCKLNGEMHKGNQNTKGKHYSEKTKKRLSETHIGLCTWSKDAYWWNNGKENRRSKICPGDGWEKGSISKSTNGMIWWNNGEINTLSKDRPGKGWEKGILRKSYKGKHWWNNGIEEKHCEVCPEGFLRGRLQKSNK